MRRMSHNRSIADSSPRNTGLQQNGEINSSECLVKYIIEQTAEAIFVCNKEGIVIRSSRLAHTLSEENPLLKKFNTLFPILFSGTNEHFSIESVLNGNEYKKAEVILTQNDGRIFNLLLNASPMVDKFKDILGCIIIFTDITEAKRAELSLKETKAAVERIEAFQHAAVEASGVGLWEYHFLTKKVFWSERMHELLGREPEFIGSWDLSNIYPDDREEFLKAIERGVNPLSNGFYHASYRIIRKDGSIAWVESLGRTVFEDTPQGRRAVVMRGATLDITSRKQIEEVVKEVGFLAQQHAAELDAIFEAIADAVLFYSAKGHPRKVNAAAISILGMDISGLDEPAFANVLEFRNIRHFDGRPMALQDMQYRRVLAGEPARRQIFYLTRPDGKNIVIEENAALVQLNGRRDGVVVVWRDITAAKQIEQALRDRENEMSMIMDAAPALIGYIDSNYRYGRVNKGYERWFCLTADEIKGLHVQDVLGAAAWQTVQPYMKKALSGQSVMFEKHLHYKIGGPRWVNITYTPDRDENGAVRGFMAHVIDISKRKQFEEALYKEREIFSFTQKAASAGSWDWNIATNELKWSPEYYKLCGLDPKKVTPCYESWLESVYPDDRAQTDLYIREYVKNENKNKREIDIYFRIQHPVKGLRWINARGRIFCDHEGKVGRMSGISIDVTELKKAEDILKRDNEMLERMVNERAQEVFKMQKEAEKTKRLIDIGLLAATVAHELRNPLASIKLAAFNVRRKCGDCRIESHLNNIDHKILESDQIINNLLFYSKIKVAHLKNINIFEILEASIEEVSKRFSEKIVSIDLQLGQVKHLSVEADAIQIKEVFTNILNNAFDALSGKGKIEISCSLTDNSLAICIKDNGEGISNENLEKVFDPFFTTKTKGTGLGLAVCRQIMLLHEGSISLISKKGEGTTVTISFPADRNKYPPKV